jgi:hypothetical protein
LINHHSIEIKASPAEIFKELLTWGESAWWPAGSPMRYTRLTEGEIGVGTRYHQKVHVPFGPEWDVEVTSISQDREVSRKFLNGMFRGVEREYIIPGRTACEVHFLMDFEVAGAVNRLLWNLIFRKKHDDNIGTILKALKGHLEGGTVWAEVVEHPATPEEADRRRFLMGIFKR